MNLSSLIENKINAIGTKASAEYFGIKESTVKIWLNTQKFPASAAQKVLDEIPDTPPGEVTEAAPQDLRVTGVAGDTQGLFPQMVRERLDDLNRRVTNLEHQRRAEFTPPDGPPPDPTVSGKPGYGFTGGAPETVMVPAGPKPVITTQSQVVPPAQQPQSPPATMLPKPYLPDTTGSWAQPWPRRNNNL